MKKNILLGVVSMLSIGLSSQVAFGQRISVPDFEFYPNLPKEATISLRSGQLLQGSWIPPHIQVYATGSSQYEAVLRVYTPESDVPVMTKLMDRNPVVQSPSPSVWPPVNPSRSGFSIPLSDNLSEGDYVAQVDLYVISIDLPREPGWIKWEYSPEPIWAKLVGSSGMNFSISNRDAILARAVKVTTTVSVQVSPLPRATAAMRNRLNSFGSANLTSTYSSVKSALTELGNSYRVEPSRSNIVYDGSQSAPLLSRNVHLDAQVFNSRLSEFQTAVGQSSVFNQTRRLSTADGSITIRVVSSVVVP